MIFFISNKRYSIGEILKGTFFRNLRIARLVAVERDVKPRNMNFAKVEKGGGVPNREGALIRINTVHCIYHQKGIETVLLPVLLH